MSGLLVALGAALGAPLRHLAGHHLDGRWPLGTLLVNLLGSGVLGVLLGAAVDGHALALLGTGFCGAFTTYSALAVQTVRLGWRSGTAYAVVTVTGCLAAATLGHGLALLLT